MAAVVGTVVGVVIERGDDDFNGSENNAFRLKRATVYVNNTVSGTPTAVAGGTDTLDCDLGAAIAAAVRNGKTQTIRGIPFVSQCLTNSVGSFAGTTTISSNTVSIRPRTSAWNADATITAVAATKPYAIACVYSEA